MNFLHRLLPVTTALLLWLPGAALATAAGADDRVTSLANVVYARPGGEELKMDIFLPPEFVPGRGEETSRPALLLIHGGGWAGGDKTAYHADARWFAERGLVCFCVQYRLVRPSANKWPVQLDDVQMAVRWVRENARKYGVNPHALAAMGGSAGGHLVSLLATRDTRDTATALLSSHSSKPECVINFCGPTDFTLPLPASVGPYNLNVQHLVDNFLGEPVSEAPELAKEASPITYAGADSSPILIIHGDKDNVVPVEHATRFHEKLKQAGATVDLLVLEGEGHGLTPANLEKLRQAALAFMKKHLR